MAGMGNERKRSRRISFDAAVAAAAEDDAGGVVEVAAEGEGGQHAVDAVGLFVDVLQDDNRAGGVGLVGGAHQSGDHGQVAADEGGRIERGRLVHGDAGSCWS
jgi:hypothetical protein